MSLTRRDMTRVLIRSERRLRGDLQTGAYWRPRDELFDHQQWHGTDSVEIFPDEWDDRLEALPKVRAAFVGSEAAERYDRPGQYARRPVRRFDNCVWCGCVLSVYNRDAWCGPCEFAGRDRYAVKAIIEALTTAFLGRRPWARRAAA